MKTIEEIVLLVPELNRKDLERWIAEALIEAHEAATGPSLSDVQYARVRLICTLRYDMDVEEETLPVVLDLIDQLHETRERLHSLSQAVLAQDDEVRAAVLQAVSQARRSGRR